MSYEFTPDQNRHIERVRVTLLHVSLQMFGIGFLLVIMGHHLPSIPRWVTLLGATFS